MPDNQSKPVKSPAATVASAMLGEAPITIADTLKHTATKVIDRMCTEFYAKDGIHSLQARLERKTLDLAKGIYELAQTAAKLGRGSPSQVKLYFSAICKVAEEHLKESKGVENVKDILPVWPVYKSTILGGMKLGLNVSDFDSFGAYKAGRVETELKASMGTEPDSRGARAEGNANRPEPNITGSTEAKVAVTPALSAVIRVMQATIGRMDEKQQDTFAQKLSDLVNKFSAKLATPEPEMQNQASDDVPQGAEEAA